MAALAIASPAEPPTPSITVAVATPFAPDTTAALPAFIAAFVTVAPTSPATPIVIPSTRPIITPLAADLFLIRCKASGSSNTSLTDSLLNSNPFSSISSFRNSVKDNPTSSVPPAPIIAPVIAPPAPVNAAKGPPAAPTAAPTPAPVTAPVAAPPRTVGFIIDTIEEVNT